MKRHTLLLFILSGLVLLEYGCKKDKPPQGNSCDGSQTMTAVGVWEPYVFLKNESIYESIDSNQSVAYDSFVIRTSFESKVAAEETTYSNYGAYAIMAPRVTMCWPIEKVEVLANFETEQIDVTSYFHLSIDNLNEGVGISNDQRFIDDISSKVSYTHNVLNFFMVEKPDTLGECTFTLRFKHSDKSSYEVTTLPFITTGS
ncbi:MAG: hypothetical protein ACPGTP_03990 [Bacteroidia bacterium]